ncbi:MAG: N-acetylmuramoyl-L-alanine amidase [Coriobacteriia bacterium]|nr:N-acetylmuramoyl-L-alanine amidase [Coriobacteriia bacterium]
MAERSRSARMDRVRGKRKRVYALVAVAAAVVVLVIAGVAFALVRSASSERRTVEAAIPASEETSASIASKVGTSTVPVEVPVLVGMQIAEAEMLVKAAGLTLVKIPTPPGDAVAGIVLAQTPAAGQRITVDTPVELVYADPAAVAVATAAPSSAPAGASGYVVCIDPGHQGVANSGQEPVGPGATETKAKVTGGASGAVTRQAEHALVLTLSFKIKERLERYGVTVVMTRTTAMVDISNAQRAQVATEAGADLFLRVHADSNTNADIRGISTLYPAGNDWVEPIREESLRAAGIVHNQMLASTGAANRGLSARSDLSGFNWSTVPTVLVEVGFLSNPNDDKQLADEAYQDNLADGIARGVLSYLGVTE